MSEFNDIFNSKQESESPPAQSDKQDFNKEEWAEKKKAERDRVYAMSDEITAQVAADPAKFRQYLDTQSRFNRYTAANAMLVMAQRPEATRLGNLDYWKQAQIYIKKDELKNPVLIMEPGGKFERDSGGIGTSYNVRKVYDVSQAQREVKPKTSTLNERTIMLALKAASPVPITVVKTLPDDRGAMYDAKTKSIQLRTEGLSGGDIIRSLTREIAMAEMSRDGNPSQNAAFKAYAVSYALCQKYGVDVSGYSFDRSAEILGSREPQEVRRELSDIRNAVADVAGRMKTALDQGRKPPNQEARG